VTNKLVDKKNLNLLTWMQEQHIHVNASCNGKGTCGQCKILCIDPLFVVTDSERDLLSNFEIESGIRLACQHLSSEKTVFKLLHESNFSILGSSITDFDLESHDDLLRIAIDIGTTTIVMLVIETDGRVINERRFLNPQRSFGADVLTRIQYAVEKEYDSVADALLNKLEDNLIEMCRNYPNRNYKIGITGNPTMTHFFMRQAVKSIIQLPYSVSVKKTKIFPISDLFKRLKIEGEIIVFPPISAYVGADIVCGLYDLNYFEQKQTRLFLDLGTNGELVLVKNGICYATSTAAGPAFEGGHLSCGLGSIDGAISDVFRRSDGTIGFETINNCEALGICGSGYIDLFAVLLNHEMEDNGFLEHDVYLTETIKLTQQDVRMFQLAKSAVRSGIEILLRKTNTMPNQIEFFDLAGGFGNHLDIGAATKIGLFPKSLEKVTQPVGNTALQGTVKMLFSVDQTYKIDQSKIEVVELADDPQFMELFTNYLYFSD